MLEVVDQEKDWDYYKFGFKVLIAMFECLERG